MLVEDLMQTDVLTVSEDLPVARLVDMLQAAHVHGAPVVDDEQRLIGFVSQEDVLLGTLGTLDGDGNDEREAGDDGEPPHRVRDIMTAPAIYTTTQASLADVGNMMWRLRIHHLPVVTRGRVVGIVSSLDFTRLLSQDGLTDH